MELVQQRGQLPCFRYKQFCVCEKKYQQQEEKICWNDWESLSEFVSSLENKSGQIVGHIDSETGKNWKNWKSWEKLGPWRTICCFLERRFCFLFRRRNNCTCVENYATIRDILLNNRNKPPSIKKKHLLLLQLDKYKPCIISKVSQLEY